MHYLRDRMLFTAYVTLCMAYHVQDCTLFLPSIGHIGDA